MPWRTVSLRLMRSKSSVATPSTPDSLRRMSVSSAGQHMFSMRSCRDAAAAIAWEAARGGASFSQTSPLQHLSITAPRAHRIPAI